MEPYKGKGNHSVKELERLIEQREEQLHLIKSGQLQARIEKLEKALGGLIKSINPNYEEVRYFQYIEFKDSISSKTMPSDESIVTAIKTLRNDE